MTICVVVTPSIRSSTASLTIVNQLGKCMESILGRRRSHHRCLRMIAVIVGHARNVEHPKKKKTWQTVDRWNCPLASDVCDSKALICSF